MRRTRMMLVGACLLGAMLGGIPLGGQTVGPTGPTIKNPEPTSVTFKAQWTEKGILCWSSCSLGYCCLVTSA